MLCVTGAERGIGEALGRIRALPEAPLHELRLDLLDELPWPLPSMEGLIVTLRGREEGGRFGGGWEKKANVLAAALRSGARYVDLEASAPESLWVELASSFGPERLVASSHRFEPLPVTSSGMAPLLDRLASRPAGTLKLAVAVTDTCELEVLRSLEADRPLVRIGMGVAGEASRVAYEAMGSPWTYVCAPGEPRVAPGQASWEDLAWIGQGPVSLLALLGGAQVEGSPGPRVYSRLAREEELPFVYVPAPTKDPVGALEVLGALGLGGASVTMPHKAAVIAVARPQGFAARVGAVNTLAPAKCRARPVEAPAAIDGQGRPGAGLERTWDGYNTDGEGVLGALGPALSGGARRAVVLGTGGAARAAAHALSEAGHEVWVLGRRQEAAEAIAKGLGRSGGAAELSAIHRLSFDVLVNATPVGAGSGDSPIELGLPWAGVTLLDMVIAPRPTALMEAVTRGGGVAVPGLHMWAHQGAAQWLIFTGRAVGPDRLRRLVEGFYDDSEETLR